MGSSQSAARPPLRSWANAVPQNNGDQGGRALNSYYQAIQITSTAPSNSLQLGNGSVVQQAPRRQAPRLSNTNVLKNPVNVVKTSVGVVQSKTTPGCFYLTFNITSTSPCTVKISSGDANVTTPGALVDVGPIEFPSGMQQVFGTDEQGNEYCQLSPEQVELHSNGGVLIKIVLTESVTEPAIPVVQETHVGLTWTTRVATQESDAASNEGTSTTGTQLGAQVVKQMVTIQGRTYVISDLYGNLRRGSGSTAPNDAEGKTSTVQNDEENECVICLSDPPNTILFPCRHVCLCHDCAKQLCQDSDKCPICRTEVVEILRLKQQDVPEQVSATDDTTPVGDAEAQERKGAP